MRAASQEEMHRGMHILNSGLVDGQARNPALEKI